MARSETLITQSLIDGLRIFKKRGVAFSVEELCDYCCVSVNALYSRPELKQSVQEAIAQLQGKTKPKPPKVSRIYFNNTEGRKRIVEAIAHYERTETPFSFGEFCEQAEISRELLWHYSDLHKQVKALKKRLFDKDVQVRAEQLLETIDRPFTVTQFARRLRVANATLQKYPIHQRVLDAAIGGPKRHKAAIRERILAALEEMRSPFYCGSLTIVTLAAIADCSKDVIKRNKEYRLLLEEIKLKKNIERRRAIAKSA